MCGFLTACFTWLLSKCRSSPEVDEEPPMDQWSPYWFGFVDVRQRERELAALSPESLLELQSRYRVRLPAGNPFGGDITLQMVRAYRDTFIFDWSTKVKFLWWKLVDVFVCVYSHNLVEKRCTVINTGPQGNVTLYTLFYRLKIKIIAFLKVKRKRLHFQATKSGDVRDTNVTNEESRSLYQDEKWKWRSLREIGDVNQHSTPVG